MTKREKSIPRIHTVKPGKHGKDWVRVLCGRKMPVRDKFTKAEVAEVERTFEKAEHCKSCLRANR